MKTKLRLLALSLVAAGVALPLVRADEPTTPAPAGEHQPTRRAKMRERRLKMLDEKLHLTDAQKQQIQAIWDKAEQQGQALRQEKIEAREEQRDKARDIMQTTRADVRAVLTPDQQKTFDDMKAERPRRRALQGAGEKPATAPAPTPTQP